MNDFTFIKSDAGVIGFISVGTRFFYKDSRTRTFENVVLNIDKKNEEIELLYKNTKHYDTLHASASFDTVCQMLDVDYLIIM